MSTLSASALATALAIAAVAAMATSGVQRDRDPEALRTPIALSVDPTEPGRCRIRYEALPSANQPAAMECEHAKWIAERWGGTVLEKTNAGYRTLSAHEGENDFSGVPVEELPRAGYCRPWLDGVAPAAQPPQGDCRWARRVADAEGGRVLFMPL